MAYFAEKNYFDDPHALELGAQLAEGKLRLEWLATPAERIKCVPRDLARGLTYQDCNAGRYGYDALPEFVRKNYSMAARGSYLVPGLPDLGYTVNRKSDVWSDNVTELYEESKTRRWVPAHDVDWQAIHDLQLPAAVQAAMCQLCTSLEEISLVMMEFPSRWVSLINQEFLELKSFQCAQMIDEARHVEVFRKRALATGGLKRASATLEQALKELLMAETYPEGSLGVHLLVGTIALSIFSQASRLSRADAKLFRLCSQDTARSVAYGVGHVRYHLAHQPAGREMLHDYLDRSEHAFAGVLASPEILEPLIILAGGGLEKEQVARGRSSVQLMIERTVEAYLQRAAAAGLERRDRSRLPAFFEATA
jgi:hypothetical protein